MKGESNDEKKFRVGVFVAFFGIVVVDMRRNSFSLSLQSRRRILLVFADRLCVDCCVFCPWIQDERLKNRNLYFADVPGVDPML